jgi:hypothetical protein
MYHKWSIKMPGFFNKPDPTVDLLTQLSQIRDQVKRTGDSLGNSGMQLAAKKLEDLVLQIDTILKNSKTLQDAKLQQAHNIEEATSKASPKP